MCNYLEISRDALRRNAAAVREAVQTPIIGVVKCDGYGVSVLEAATAWQTAGVSMFGVSRPQEALTLRRLGFREQILLLCPVSEPQTLRDMVDNDIILTVNDFENAFFYSTNAMGGPVRVHIAVDTGMGRFGIRWTDLEQLKGIYSLCGLSFEGIFSHFSNGFEEKYRITKRQLSRFLWVTRQLQEAGCPVGVRHIASSCGALRFPQTRLDAVRVGSALVGRAPVRLPVELERVGVFRAQVVARKLLQPGDTTGYGACCGVKKRKNAVVVALGRADGFGLTETPDRLDFRAFCGYAYRLLRQWRHPPYVVWEGKKLPVLGRVGNQHTLFDATDLDVKPGDWVTWEGDLMRNSCERRFV